MEYLRAPSTFISASFVLPPLTPALSPPGEREKIVSFRQLFENGVNQIDSILRRANHRAELPQGDEGIHPRHQKMRPVLVDALP